MTKRDREVTLSWKEIQKLEVLKEVEAGKRTQVSAAATLGVSDRWIRTMLKRLNHRGSRGLIHGNRGRPSKRRIPETLREQIVELYRGKYGELNLTHFREMLEEREGLKAPGREWLRCTLGEARLWQARRRAPQHRQRRPRRERAGELLQLDASMHAWLGEDQPRIALVGSVDDATGDVEARFFPAETTEAYLTLFGLIIRKRGVPRAVYSDRHGIFVVNNAKEADLQRAQGKTFETQVSRALKELGIEWIPAYSPQAKGRIERLWGVFQDRLLNELRLENIRTMQEANEYLQKRFLPRYNRKFRVKAIRKDHAYRPAPLNKILQGILCWKDPRILARDHTFSWEGKLWQVLRCPSIPVLTGRRIEVRRTLRGTIEAWLGEIRLTLRRGAPFMPARELKSAEPSYRMQGRLRR